MLRKIKSQWLFITIFIFITISGSFFLRGTQQLNLHFAKTTSRTTEASYALARMKHVTKSLAELGKMDEINKHFLFLNQVPKCGSEILILLLQKMQGLNNYRHVRLKDGKRQLKKFQQEELVYEIYDVIRKEAIPLSFDRHVYFINFTSFDKQMPTYINLIRDPVDKIISRMSYKDETRKIDFYLECLTRVTDDCNFKNGKPYDLTIPYFCGHDPRCMLLNNHWALQTAKNNVEKYYSVVGILEELNTTLEILEYKIPYFFKGAQKIYYRDLLHIYKKKRQPVITKGIRQKLKDTLFTEYEFYEWIKNKLFKQLQILYGDHNSH